jgi:hypothetical protein
MKLILAGVAFAALLGAPVFAQPLKNHEQPAAGIYPSDAQVRGDSREPIFTQPTPNPESMQQELCDTAHDFCPDFHGDND